MKHVLDNSFEVSGVPDDHEEGLTKSELSSAVRMMIFNRLEDIGKKEALIKQLEQEVSDIRADIKKLNKVHNNIW